MGHSTSVAFATPALVFLGRALSCVFLVRGAPPQPRRGPCVLFILSFSLTSLLAMRSACWEELERSNCHQPNRLCGVPLYIFCHAVKVTPQDVRVVHGIYTEAGEESILWLVGREQMRQNASRRERSESRQTTHQRA